MAEPSALIPGGVFDDLPEALRVELIGSFSLIIKNFAEGRWEPAELNGGKLCEVVYSIVKGMASGKYPKKASKPRNLVDACRALESDTSLPRSARIQIPRMLLALYEIRNNRNVGHVGGEVDPNHMDSLCVVQMSKWVVAELIRILHDIPVDAAATLVDALTERDIPLIWEVNGRRRVLDSKLSMKDKTLVLLHSSPGPVPEADLVSWVEHSNASVFRRDVLRPLHRTRLVEYDRKMGSVEISPLGIEQAEDLLRERVKA